MYTENDKKVFNIFQEFNNLIKDKKFVQVRDSKIVEILFFNESFDADHDGCINLEGRSTPRKYVEKELNWYLSQDLNIRMVKDVEIWKQISSSKDEINSNYGYLAFSAENFGQFYNVIRELVSDKNSRRAIMVYQRPSIWRDYNRDGMNDFICTNYNHFFIRDNKLIMKYDMRSNDFIFGFYNDFYWANYLYNRVYSELLISYPDLKKNKIHWHANSFHVYERHFKMVEDVVQKNINRYELVNGQETFNR